MAEIKFTIARMQEVYSRIDEIGEQLKAAMTEDAQLLNNISSNIENESITSVLIKYSEENNNSCTSTLQELSTLKEYLMNQIVNYSRSDAQAQSDLTSVQSILDQL